MKGAGASFHPLDRVLGLSQAEASPALREAVCELATRVPYRQVDDLAHRLTGEPLSHQSTWRILQQQGTRVRTEEGELVASVFELGQAPEGIGLSPDLVVVEADGTYVAAQREEGDRFEIKTGVFYTGKDRAGGRRHRRWRLLNKGCYATTGDQDAFGKGLAARGFAWVRLHRARHVLGLHDGLDEYGQGFRDWFPRAVHQIDHFHVAERIWQVSGAEAQVFEPLKRLAFSDPVACAMKLRRSVRPNPETAAEVAGYLEAVAPDLDGVDRLPRRLRRGRMHVVGSAIVEKHQDLLVKRKKKGRGMRWTRRGAANLLALQAPTVLRPVADELGGDRRLRSPTHGAPGSFQSSVCMPSVDRGAGGQGEPLVDSSDSTAEVGTLRGAGASRAGAGLVSLDLRLSDDV